MTFPLFSLVLFAFLYPVWVVHRQTLGMHETVEKTPEAWPAPYDDICFTTNEGILLKGWWVAAESRKAVLLLHGNGGSQTVITAVFSNLSDAITKEVSTS